MISNNIKIVFLFVLFSILVSCGNSNRFIEQQVIALIGKKVVFPDSIELWKNRRLDSGIENQLLRNKSKIIAVIDIDCSACIRDISEWNKYLEAIKNTCDLYIVVKALNKDSFKDFIQYKIPQDIYVLNDKSGSLLSLNSIPEIGLFQTILLDNRNCIKLIGSPIHNKKLKILYDKEIRNMYLQNSHKRNSR